MLGDVACSYDSYSSNPRVKKKRNSQRTKKLMSNSPGLEYFDVGLVDFILHLSIKQVKVLVEYVFEEINLIHYSCQNL